MEMEDLGIEAKEATVREVAKILPLPDRLVSIASIKADYLSRQRVRVAPLGYPRPLLLLVLPRTPRMQRGFEIWFLYVGQRSMAENNDRFFYLINPLESFK
ncbi:hypothetical protein MUK42_21046 [Musa troglodytarum]|uniref:Uncharacterized protein n=1 Tax=Musa troglodytarum TaxID=320322 RepID=A0A9E7G9Q6_9LILI|nr:hypothetical protein MUK42_21046 [Musa troglodytarum]